MNERKNVQRSAAQRKEGTYNNRNDEKKMR